jgi:hypothetical protein
MLLQHLEECYLAAAIPSQSAQSRPLQITTGEVAKKFPVAIVLKEMQWCKQNCTVQVAGFISL